MRHSSEERRIARSARKYNFRPILKGSDDRLDAHHADHMAPVKDPLVYLRRRR